jgi:MOSC domain-containing protein YiiM
LRIVSINISDKKSVKKNPVKSALFKEDFGIVGDAHAGPGIRQVSLLSKEAVDEFKKNPLLKICVKEGSFGENLTTQGVDYTKIRLGDRLKINDVVLEISKIGKECHTQCAIGKSVGTCIMPKEGVFAIVLNGGEVNVGDGIDLC